MGGMEVALTAAGLRPLLARGEFPNMLGEVTNGVGDTSAEKILQVPGQVLYISSVISGW